jgi:hypothetical protein
MGVLSGFCAGPRIPRIPPVTWANDEPLETVANRWAPMACGPNVDQATIINLPAEGVHAGMLWQGGMPGQAD